jgi:hypothetical protein
VRSALCALTHHARDQTEEEYDYRIEQKLNERRAEGLQAQASAGADARCHAQTARAAR